MTALSPTIAVHVINPLSPDGRGKGLIFYVLKEK